MSTLYFLKDFDDVQIQSTTLLLFVNETVAKTADWLIKIADKMILQQKITAIDKLGCISICFNNWTAFNRLKMLFLTLLNIHQSYDIIVKHHHQWV